MTPPSSEAITKMTTKSVWTCMVESRCELTARTHLLTAQGIVEFLRNKLIYVLVTDLTKKAVTILKHYKLAKLTEISTVKVNMIDETDAEPINTQVGSANTCPVYKGAVTEEDRA